MAYIIKWRAVFLFIFYFIFLLGPLIYLIYLITNDMGKLDLFLLLSILCIIFISILTLFILCLNINKEMFIDSTTTTTATIETEYLLII
jgi:lipid-A-disaccharide synthase-like uncharacterized protein